MYIKGLKWKQQLTMNDYSNYPILKRLLFCKMVKKLPAWWNWIWSQNRIHSSMPKNLARAKWLKPFSSSHCSWHVLVTLFTSLFLLLKACAWDWKTGTVVDLCFGLIWILVTSGPANSESLWCKLYLHKETIVISVFYQLAYSCKNIHVLNEFVHNHSTW